MSFSIGEVLREGWQTFKKRPWFLIGVTLVVFIIPSIPSAIADEAEAMELFGFVLNLVSWVLSLLMSIGMIKVTLAFVDGGMPAFKDLFAHYRLLWKYFLASILYGLIVIGGLILLIIPGIIWALRYQFAAYLIVDKNMGILDAFRKSSAITEGHKWNLLGYVIIQAIINLLGMLALGIGLLVTAPITMLAYAKIYRQLESGLVPAPIAPPAAPVPPTPPTPPAPTSSSPPPQTPPVS